ncbi:MAG: hypothetical protein PF545_01490 [Elusimicrobia bacterium]|jgi:hypothetical protein|nr:hypothetical protein [Elusimicrobiota bacterium]
MSARKIKTRQENRSKSEFYLKKAGDNYKQMMKALKDKNYNAAGTLAVQCAISAGDAVSVHEKGIRSVSRKSPGPVRVGQNSSPCAGDKEEQHFKENYQQKEPYPV